MAGRVILRGFVAAQSWSISLGNAPVPMFSAR